MHILTEIVVDSIETFLLDGFDLDELEKLSW